MKQNNGKSKSIEHQKSRKYVYNVLVACSKIRGTSFCRKLMENPGGEKSLSKSLKKDIKVDVVVAMSWKT